MDSPARKRSNAIRRIGIVAGSFVAIYGLALAVLSPAGFPEVIRHGSKWPYLADAPLGEDAFYALTVAWNIARGDGIVYNQRMPTTGIQPGVTFVYAGLASLVQTAGGNKFLFCRVVLAFNVGLLLLFAHHAGAFSRRIGSVVGISAQTGYWTAFTIACTSCHVFNTFGYALETGVYAVLVCWIARTSFDLFDGAAGSLRRWLPLAIACGAAALVRVDFLILLAGFLGCAVLARPRLFRNAALVAGVTLLFAAPWLLHIVSITGSPLQSSALAQWEPAASRGVFLSRLYYLLLPVATTAVPAGGNASVLFGIFSPMAGAAIAAALGIVYLCTSDWRSILRILARSGIVPALACWGAGLGLLIAVYAVYVDAVWFYARYMFVAAALTLPLASAVLAAALADRRAIARRVASVVLLASVASFPLGLWGRYHRGLGHYEQPILAGIVHDQYPDAVVGAFQSGVVGFFNENVVNLDGKMNIAALRHIRSRTLGRYIEETGIRAMLDWNLQFTSFMSSKEDREYLESAFECRELPAATYVVCPTWRCTKK